MSSWGKLFYVIPFFSYPVAITTESTTTQVTATQPVTTALLRTTVTTTTETTSASTYKPPAGFCNGKITGNYPAPTRCDGYIACVHGTSIFMKCPADLQYNATLDICDWKRNVVCPHSEYSIRLCNIYEINSHAFGLISKVLLNIKNLGHVLKYVCWKSFMKCPAKLRYYPHCCVYECKYIVKCPWHTRILSSCGTIHLNLPSAKIVSCYRMHGYLDILKPNFPL